MGHPFEHWPATGRRRALVAISVAAVAMWLVLALLDGPLRDTGDGTIDFELAGTPERAREIIDGWRADDVLTNAAFSIGLDFVFPLLYGTALAGLCVAAAGGWRLRGRRQLASLGIALAWAAMAAGVLDWIEDVALGVSLLDEPASPWPEIAKTAAIPKFGGTGLALLFALVSALLLALQGRAQSPDS